MDANAYKLNEDELQEMYNLLTYHSAAAHSLAKKRYSGTSSASSSTISSASSEEKIRSSSDFSNCREMFFLSAGFCYNGARNGSKPLFRR